MYGVPDFYQNDNVKKGTGMQWRHQVVSDLPSKGSFYIAQYPVRWTAQSALHFLPSLIDLFIPTPFSASPGSILAMQQLRATTKSLTFPPLSIARNIFDSIQFITFYLPVRWVYYS